MKYFLPFLSLLFIALKLTGEIDWGWLWVLMPIIVPFGAITFLALIGMALILWAELRGGAE